MNNPTPASTTPVDLSLAAAPTRRWGAWVAGIAATLGAAVAAVALLTASPAPAPVAAQGHDEVALNDRLDAIADRTAGMKDRIAALKAKRDKISSATLPDAPAPKPGKVVKPPKPRPEPKPDPVTPPITIDKDCIGQPTGCLQHH